MSIFKSKNFSLLQKGAVFFAAVFCCIVFLFPTHGYAEEADTTELLFSQNLYHKHIGNSSSNGGCYTVKKTRKKTEEEKCQGTMVYYPEVGRTSCDKCGGSYSGDQSGRECWETTTKTVTETYYDIGCKMTTNTQMGTLTVRKSTDDWTKSLTLQAFYEVSDKVKVKENPFIWNGADATTESEFLVTENGNYTLQLNAGSNVNTQKGIVTVPVTNIDVTGPVVQSMTQQPLTEWTKDGVVVSGIVAADLQPDQSYGCGVHGLPFSYDGGATWTEEDTHLYTENGTYEILVRDKLENISTQSVLVSNIDVTPPSVLAEYDHGANQKEVTITVTAQDLQPDGSTGCGLHEEAFSYDGGKNWSAETEYTVRENGTVEIAVRDKLDNIYKVEEGIGNIDNKGPLLEYTLVPDTWTNQSVTVHLTAIDKNADGSDGIGLPPEWYSLDGGSSWLSEGTLIADENKTIDITLRDLHNNQSIKQIVIDNIDKSKPKVSIVKRKKYIDGKRRMELTAKAKDEGSGLAKKAYSWEGNAYGRESSIIVSSNGTYVVKVRDKVGNTGWTSIEIDSFPEDEEEETDIPKTTEEETTTVPEEPATEPDGPEESDEDDPSENETEEWDSEEETETGLLLMEERIDEPEAEVGQELQKESGSSVWKKLIAILLAVMLLLIILLLLWVWLRTIAVYVKDHTGKMCYVGRRWISFAEDRYEVKVPETLLEKCETTQFCFKPAWGFVQLHEDEEMFFYFPENVCTSHNICEKMEISLF